MVTTYENEIQSKMHLVELLGLQKSGALTVVEIVVLLQMRYMSGITLT